MRTELDEDAAAALHPTTNTKAKAKAKRKRMSWMVFPKSSLLICCSMLMLMMVPMVVAQEEEDAESCLRNAVCKRHCGEDEDCMVRNDLSMYLKHCLTFECS